MLKSTKLKNTLLAGATAILVSCGGQKEIKMGSYAYDAQFLKDHGIEYTELVSADGNSKVMVIPAWQGRVMTTSASGDEGDSYGWINYRFINEGKVSSQFNPVGVAGLSALVLLVRNASGLVRKVVRSHFILREDKSRFMIIG